MLCAPTHACPHVSEISQARLSLVFFAIFFFEFLAFLFGKFVPVYYCRVHQDYTHSEIILELISVLITLTPLIVLGINFKSVIGALWDYTCTPEITLTLLNYFQINFQKITLTLTLLLVFELRM